MNKKIQDINQNQLQVNYCIKTPEEKIQLMKRKYQPFLNDEEPAFGRDKRIANY